MKPAIMLCIFSWFVSLTVACEPSPEYIGGEEFHRNAMPVYTGEVDWPVNKKGDHMAKVKYSPSHFNPAFEDSRRGQGDLYATWIFSEQPETAEGIMKSALQLVMKARLDPNASFGIHKHEDTEEVYYILEGSLTVTTMSADGSRQITETLYAGDAHQITFGQSHTGMAGDAGATFIAIEMGR